MRAPILVEYWMPRMMAAALVFTLKAKLLPALLAGLLVYELVAMLAPRFVGGKLLSHSRAKIVVVALISASVLAILIGIVVVFKLQPLTAHLKLQTDKNAFQHLWHTVQKKDYRVGFTATTLLSLGGFMLMPFTSAFLVNNVLIAQADLPVVFFFTGISSMIIMPLIGRISDRVDKYRIFVFGSAVAAVMVLVYTNLPPIPIWQVVMINMVMFMGIMSRMVPASALTSAVPEMYDRGAFMSINASLQQMAGGAAAMFAGFVVVQPTESSPLQHFNILGYVMVAIMVVEITSHRYAGPYRSKKGPSPSLALEGFNRYLDHHSRFEQQALLPERQADRNALGDLGEVA